MTKQLLTALLVAGLSATAKAEPVVYYCTTTQFAEVFVDKVIKIKDYRFKLFVDLQNKLVKIAGEIGEFQAMSDDVFVWSLPQTSEQIGFFGGNPLGNFDFRNNTLAYTKAGSNSDGELFVQSLVARCDKF